MTGQPSPRAAGGRVDIVISRVLRYGVTASLALVALGTLLGFVRSGEYGPHGGTAADLHRLIGTAATSPLAWRGFATALTRLQGRALIVAGLLVLIATPVARVAISVVAFALERDWKFVAITALVFALLIVSFLAG